MFFFIYFFNHFTCIKAIIITVELSNKLLWSIRYCSWGRHPISLIAMQFPFSYIAQQEAGSTISVAECESITAAQSSGPSIPQQYNYWKLVKSDTYKLKNKQKKSNQRGIKLNVYYTSFWSESIALAATGSYL